MNLINAILQLLGFNVILITYKDVDEITAIQSRMVKTIRATHDHRVVMAEIIEELTEAIYDHVGSHEKALIDYINNTNAEQLPLTDFQISEWEKRFCKDE